MCGLHKKIIVIICGPTAVGKTACSIAVARRIGGEIVSADSMQLYRYMNIGSAKPSKEELAAVPHHLVDAADPREAFSAARYQKAAREAIREIFDRGRVPVISGGTGLYINALLYEMDFGAGPADLPFRREMEELARREGNEALHRRLAEADPRAAERIHPNSVKRVIRALELSKAGAPLKPFEQAFRPVEDYKVILTGLCRPREELYDRINRRADQLLEKGLTEEVRSLLGMGLTEADISMKGIGYKEIIGFIRGAWGFEEAAERMKRNTRNYAKRQMTWFRRYEGITWFDLSSYESEKQGREAVAEWIEEALKRERNR